MAKTNSALQKAMGSKVPNPRVVAANAIPKPDTVNKSGSAAYTQDKWFRLLTMLNTLKLQPQYYRTQKQTLVELQALIKECATENLYLTCQCIVYSRCLGEGMRTISHAAAVFIAPFVSGQEYSKRFYGIWDKKNKRGGVIFRPDDMAEIIAGFVALNGEYKTTTTITESKGETTVNKTVDITGTKLTNAMKKGFKSAIESLDTYSLLKYKSSLIDVINLVHPKGSESGATVKVDGEDVYTIDAIMRGLSVSAETWEANQSEAGQIVAKAVKEGKIDEAEAKTILTEAKADNWKELLDTNRLPILAGVRNLRNIISNNPQPETMTKLCNLVSDARLIREGKVMPYQLDLANDVMMSEFSNGLSRQISGALAKGYVEAVPNLAAMLPGRNVIFLDMSGSMSGCAIKLPNGKTGQSSAQKASLLAATIAKATNADVIIFGTSAQYVQYNPNVDVFTLAKQLCNPHMGGTNLSTAWSLAQRSGNTYDRVFILSDNEVNRGSTYDSYMSYVKSVGHPYVYSVDLAGYGTNCIAGEKVRYYYGYGFSMFDDIVSSEFNPEYHMEKVKQVII
jgi:polyhydroxyalkanoate synthesis regulator phasin